MTIPDPDDFGLADEELFDVEKSMGYWKQYSPEDFALWFSGWLQTRIMATEALVKVIADTPHISALRLGEQGNWLVGKAYEFILKNQREAADMLRIVRAYSEFLRSQKQT